jgi:hypothetical protein
LARYTVKMCRGELPKAVEAAGSNPAGVTTAVSYVGRQTFSGESLKPLSLSASAVKAEMPFDPKRTRSRFRFPNERGPKVT